MRPIRTDIPGVPRHAEESKRFILKACPLYKPLFCRPPEGRTGFGHAADGEARTIRYRSSVRLSRFVGFLALAVFILLSAELRGQEVGRIGGPELFHQSPFSGSLSLSTEYRSMDREYGPERDDLNGGNLFGTLSLEHRFASGRIPADMTFSTVGDVRGNPYLRFGIHPELLEGDLKLHAGDFYADASDLTLGDVSLFGGGAEVKGGAVRGGLWYGKVERPYTFDADTLPDRSARTALGGRIGFGSDRRGFADVTFIRIADREETGFRNEENLMIGTEFFLPLFAERLSIRGEGVVSAWSGDLAGEELPMDVPFFTPRESSQFDGAASFGLHYDPSINGSLSLDGRWIGPGYVNLAQPYMRNDLFEASLNPSLSLLAGRLYASGSIGLQWDNLRGTKEGRTTQVIGSLFTTLRPAEWVTLALSFNDFGASSDHAEDTIRYGYVSRALSFSPTFYWNGLGGSQVGSVNASLQRGRTRNPGGDFSESSVAAIDALWTLILPSTLSLTTGAGYGRTEAEAYHTEYLSLRETISRSMLEGKLIGSLTVGISHYRVEGGTSLDLNGSLAYDLGRPGTLSLTLSNSVDKGFGSSGGTTRELYGALRYGLRL